MPPVIPPHDPFFPLLEECLDYNYPPLKPKEDVFTPIENPVTFYDRHVGANLILKSIKLVPSIPRHLAKVCDASFEEFVRNGHRLDPKDYPHQNGSPQKMHYATSVGEQYRISVAEECLALVSRLCLYPQVSTWEPLFSFATFDYQSQANDPFLTEGRAYAAYSSISSDEYMKFLQDTVDQETQDMINDIPRMPWLAIWSFFALTRSGESVLTRMDSMSNFRWEGAHTIGSPFISASPRPLDALNTLLLKEMKQQFPTTDRMSNKAKRVRSSGLDTLNVQDGKKIQVSKRKAAQVRLPGRRGVTKRSYRPNVNDYVQRTWAAAVTYDSTFLIFNCGSYERIGLRHRASQTLYLSDLIDTSHTNPKYRTIHMGLHLAIVQDIIERRRIKKNQEKSSSEPNIAKNKRSAEHLGIAASPSSKRPKLTTDVSMRPYNEGGYRTPSQVVKEIGGRQLALIKLDYDAYCSPSPSSFIREGQSCVSGVFSETLEQPPKKTTYSSKDYMTITLGQPIGKGAIGVVHQATIEVEVSSGEKLHLPCLVKLVFSEKDHAATRQEFKVYKHLAAKKVLEGIVPVHGLFQDIETGTLALVMGHGGRTLRTIQEENDPEFVDHEITVTKEEFAVYLRIVDGIHRAGVVHCDIRLDNIVVNEDNEISIIDFDRAMLLSSSEASEHPEPFEQEIYDLQQILGNVDETQTEDDDDNEEGNDENTF